MAQELQFTFGEDAFSCGIRKVDRSMLYGSVDHEVLDENGEPCKLATLANDGQTLIPSGGTAIAYFSDNGLWRDKADLTPVNLEGAEIEPVKSSFKQEIALVETATLEQYLSHSIRLVYHLTCAEGFAPAFVKELEKGAIFTFPFSYRGGLEADAAFILQGTDGTAWMLVGNKTRINLVGFDQAGGLAETDEDEGDEDDIMDFGMM